MASRLIELEDGTLVEIEATGAYFEEIAGSAAEKVGAAMANVKPLLLKVVGPIADAWAEINQEMHVEQAEVELGLSFEGEGNLYVTKAKAGANITVKLVLKPQKPTDAKG